MHATPAKAPVLQGLYFLTTGIWPLLDRRSFERVTGPRADFWLAQTVGVLVAGIGSALLLAVRHRRITPELEFLGLASAAGLGAVDLVFGARGRISKVYLVDAGLEAVLVAGRLARGRLGSGRACCQS